MCTLKKAVPDIPCEIALQGLDPRSLSRGEIVEIGAFVSPEQVVRFAKAGADFAELVFSRSGISGDRAGFDAVLDRAQSWPIPVRAFSGFMPGSIKVCGPDFDRSAQDQYLASVLPRAREIGGPGAIVTFGSAASRQIPAGFDRERALDQIADFLRRASLLATANELRLTMENQNSRESNVFNTVGECGEFLRERAIEDVWLTVDYYHMLMEQESLLSIESFRSRVSHVHLTDVGKRAPGTGDAPFRDLFVALQQIGYSGRISMEVTWEDFDKEVDAAVSYLRSLSASVGI